MWVTINVANGETVPVASDYHGVVITGSRFNVRDRDQLPWFEGVCELVRQAAATGSPNVYGEWVAVVVVVAVVVLLVDELTTRGGC